MTSGSARRHPLPDAERWMSAALEEARLAAEEGEIPVGAVAVLNGRLVGRGHNRTRALADPTAHAEIIAVTAACQTLGEEHLEGVHLFVTLEPCPMCAGALVLARAAAVTYGAADPKAGACGSVMDIVRDPRLNHRLEVYSGVLSDQCSRLLADFFARLRN